MVVIKEKNSSASLLSFMYFGRFLVIFPTPVEQTKMPLGASGS